MKKLKIYITQIGHPDLKGGGNAVARYLSESFAKRGHIVTTIYISPKNLLSNRPKATHKIVFIKKLPRIPIMNCLKTAATIKKLSTIKDGRPDVIISLGYEGFLIPFIKGKSMFIAASHNFLRSIEIRDFLNLKWLNPFNWGKLIYLTSVFIDKLTKFKADFVQCLCQFGADRCKTLYKMSDNKIFIVSNGVDTKKFTIRPMPKKKTIFFIGSAVEHKGLDILIRALPIVTKAYLDIEVFVLGEANKREKSLIQFAKELGVNSKINWQRSISQNQMPKFYQKAYLVVLPSRLDLFPMTALETMSSGIPLIAAKIGGLPEIIEDGVSGLIINKEDSEELATAIIKLLDDPKKAEEMGKKGREIVEQKFTWEKVVEKYEKEIYNRLNT